MTPRMLLGLLIIGFSAINLKAQDDEEGEGRVLEFENGETITVTGKKDNPENFYNIGLAYGANVGAMPESPLYGMLLNLKLDYTNWDLGSWYFKTDLQVVRSFATKYDKINDLDSLKTSNPIKPYNVFETGLEVNLISDNKRKVKELTVDQEKTGYKEYQVYKADFKVAVKKMLKARVGFHNYNVTVTNYQLKPTTLKSKDGTEIYELDREIYNSIDLPEIDKYHTNMNVNSLFFGLSYHSISDTKIELESGGSMYNSSHFNLFADIMYAPSITFADMEVGDQTYVVDHENGGGFESRNVGFRLGMEYDNKISKYSGVTYGFEIGQRPGWDNISVQNWISNSIYFMFTINGKVGLSRELF